MMTEKEINAAIDLLSKTITAMQKSCELSESEAKWQHALQEARKVRESSVIAKAEKRWLAKCAHADKLWRRVTKLREARCRKATLAFSEMKAHLNAGLGETP